MALFIEPPNLVFSPNVLALAWITGFNGSFEYTQTTLRGSPVLKVAYHKTSMGFGEERIDQIANFLSHPIVLSPVNSTHLLDDGTPITDVSATVLWDGNVQIVLWDSTECDGDGYHVFGVTGKPIPNPAWVYVAHELSHAFHNALETAPSGSVALELQATLDENAHRAQHGLPLRDPANHGGGCGPGPVLWWLPQFPLDLLKVLTGP